MPKTETVERYSRGARWLHAIVYIVVLIELATGWWWILASYRPSFVEELTGIPDWVLHEYLGLWLIPVFLGHFDPDQRIMARMATRRKPLTRVGRRCLD